jgi:hypothetical protein
MLQKKEKIYLFVTIIKSVTAYGCKVRQIKEKINTGVGN